MADGKTGSQSVSTHHPYTTFEKGSLKNHLTENCFGSVLVLSGKFIKLYSIILSWWLNT